MAEAARALTDRGIAPTVARVRAALGGGSPNDLAPALKQWKESFAPAPTSGTRTETPAIPVQISDLAQELWQRATVAAAIDLKGGPTARALTTRTEEAEALRQQVKNLRDQLERESVMYGAVSYTHLDVYKRQVYSLPRFSQLTRIVVELALVDRRLLL